MLGAVVSRREDSKSVSLPISFEDIKTILDHRYPMLMVDKVVKLEKNKSITTQKNVSANEPHFLGHFPEKAVMPGAMIMETISQSTLLLFHFSDMDIDCSDAHLIFSKGVNGKFRFMQPVLPGDVLLVNVSYATTDTRKIIKATVKVHDELVSKSTIEITSF